jgi:hypothetical protein
MSASRFACRAASFNSSSLLGALWRVGHSNFDSLHLVRHGFLRVTMNAKNYVRISAELTTRRRVQQHSLTIDYFPWNAIYTEQS